MKAVLKFVLMVFVLAGLALALQQHQEPLAPLPEDNAELTVWSVAPGLDEIGQLFQSRHNIRLQIRTFNSGTELYKSLQLALKNGEATPDVARVEYAFLPWLQRHNGLLELPKTPDFFAPWAAAQVSSLGAVYAVPQDIGAMALVYRQDIFERYNVTAPRTWADFARIGETLAARSNNQIKLTNFDRSSLFLASLVWAQGGQFWTRDQSGYTQTLDTPISRQVLTYWGGLIRKNIVSTTAEYSVEHWNALRSGRLASAIVPAWALGAYARNLEPAIAKGAVYRLAALPSAGRSSTGNLGGSSLVVAKATKYPKAATAFALFAATSAEAITQLWTQEARLPAMKTGFDLLETTQAATVVFEENPAKIYEAASKVIPERFEWSPWLPTADAVYRKLFDAALENKISFGQLSALWQNQSLELAWREGFAVR